MSATGEPVAAAQAARRSTKPPEGVHGLPVCVICLRGADTPRRAYQLTHGVAVWLCDQHGSVGYRCRDGGRHFTERLLRVWRAAGALTTRRLAALEQHERRVEQAEGQRDRPGSYAWPELRAELEERFATGTLPSDVFAEVRERYQDCPARMPSERTIRRWHSQARWLPSIGLHRPKPRGRQPHPYVPWAFVLLPRVLKEELLWLYPSFARQRGP